MLNSSRNLQSCAAVRLTSRVKCRTCPLGPGDRAGGRGGRVAAGGSGRRAAAGGGGRRVAEAAEEQPGSVGRALSGSGTRAGIDSPSQRWPTSHTRHSHLALWAAAPTPRHASGCPPASRGTLSVHTRPRRSLPTVSRELSADS